MRLATRTSVVRPSSLTRPPHRRCVAADRRSGSADGMRRDATGPDAGLGLPLMSASHDLLRLSPEVREALETGGAVVALESTITTHGLPRPENLRAARAAEAAVRAAGAVPATVATHDGRIRVGLGSDELEALAEARDIPKVSRQNLAAVLGQPRLGRHDRLGHDDRGGPGRHRGLRHRRHRRRAPGRRVVPGHQRRPRRAGAHAGDGGLRGAEVHPRRRPHARGARDPGRARSSPGRATRWRASTVGAAGTARPCESTTAEEAARLITTQRQPRALDRACSSLCRCPRTSRWQPMRSPLRSSVPRPRPPSSGVRGPASTPFVLCCVAELTDGRSVRANLALIEHNARVAGELTVALVGLRGGSIRSLGEAETGREERPSSTEGR